MAITRLSIIGTPGRPYSFTAKAPLAIPAGMVEAGFTMVQPGVEFAIIKPGVAFRAVQPGIGFEIKS